MADTRTAPTRLQMLVEAIRRHHFRLLALRSLNANRVGAMWDRQANVDEPAAKRFAASAAVQSRASVQATAVLAEGLMRVLDELMEAPPLESVTFTPFIRNDTPLEVVYERPIITARTALANGAMWEDAMQLGRDRAVSAAATDVMLANRQAIVDAGDRRPWVVGYRRVLTGESCALCATASTQRYRTGELAPIHNHCDCDVAPIYGTADPGNVIDEALLRRLRKLGPEYWKKNFRDVRVTENGEIVFPEVAVREHGELGPVLTVAGDHFTGPSDI